MKNIITTIAIMLLSVNVKAQDLVVNVDTVYSFKHPKSVPTPKAFDSGLVSDFGVSAKSLQIVFDDLNKTITTLDGGVVIEVSYIREISYVNDEKWYYTNIVDRKGVLCGGGFVITKGKDGNDYLAGAVISPENPNVVNGFYGKIKKGDE
jgi:hypothetical protein